MKNRVNLYTDALKPRLELLNLNFVLFCCLLTILCIFAVAYWVGTQQEQIKQHLAETEQRQQDRATLLAQANAKLGMQQQDPKLAAQVSELEVKVEQQRALLEALRQQEGLKDRGFSPLMIALAEQHLDSIGLQLIQQDGQHLRLQGVATSATAVPDWLSKLGQEAYFKNTSFSEARLYRDDKQQLHFLLNSIPVSGEAN